MKRTILGAGAAALTAMVIMIAGAGSASAAYSNCPNGRSCFWGDLDYKTADGVIANPDASYLPFQYNFRNFANYNYPSTSINGTNSASSVVNNGNSAKAQYYAGIDYTYPTFILAPGGERDPNLSNGIDTAWSPYYSGSDVNDALSSACFIGYCT